MSHKKTAFRATHVVVVYIREVCGMHSKRCSASLNANYLHACRLSPIGVLSRSPARTRWLQWGGGVGCHAFNLDVKHYIYIP